MLIKFKPKNRLNGFIQACFLVGMILCLKPTIALAQPIQALKFEGLIRHDAAIVKSYLPEIVGQQLNDENYKDIIQSLYDSGFFDNIQLLVDEQTLTIKVKERPTIVEIEFKGNNLIETELLTKNLKAQGIAVNRAFNQTLFNRIRRGLKTEYFNAGYYAVKIDSRIESLTRQRVKLLIEIKEGDAAKIERIDVIGNKTFSNKQLLRQFTLSPYSETSLFGEHEYQKLPLEGSFEALKNYYFDRGFAQFQILSSQVQLSPEKSAVYITLNIEEGLLFHFSGIAYTGYEKVLSKKRVDGLNEVEAGQVFSRRKILNSIENLKTALGDKGYAFADVRPNIQLDTQTKLASVTIIANPKKKVYVKRIEIIGNNASIDSVVRREMTQYEGALYVPRLVRNSEARLNRTSFFSSVSVTPRKISDNQVILTVKVKDVSTGSFNARVGFTLSGGASFGISLTESNWLGRGYNVSFNANKDSAVTQADISITDPYYTPENISLTWGLNFSETDARQLNQASYLSNRLGGNVSFGVPFNAQQRFNYGALVERTKAVCGTGFIECESFASRFREGAIKFAFTFSWNYDTRNRGIFPTKGTTHRVYAILGIPNTDIDTFEITSLSSWYFPLAADTAVLFKQRLGIIQTYSGNQAPFFDRFYTGGVTSVRGYLANTLGEQYNTADGASGARGGAFVWESRFQTLFPPFGDDNDDVDIRYGPFVDVGNVFVDPKNIDFSALRGSYGIGFLWLTPIGQITLNYAEPFNHKSSDSVQQFQFGIGSGF